MRYALHYMTFLGPCPTGPPNVIPDVRPKSLSRDLLTAGGGPIDEALTVDWQGWNIFRYTQVGSLYSNMHL